LVHHIVGVETALVERFEREAPCTESENSGAEAGAVAHTAGREYADMMGCDIPPPAAMEFE
jgi:hypothetical protein